MNVVDSLHQAQDVFLVDDDARQSEDAPCRIIRMDGHLDVVLIADRHDRLQEVNQVVKQLFVVDILIQFKQLLYLGHALRFPARHDGSVHIAGNGIEHLFRIDAVNSFLGICQHCGTVCPLSGQFGSCPVEDGHEVVADKMDVLFTKVSQAFDIGFDVLVPVSGTGLDRIGNIDTFNAFDLQAGCFHFVFQSTDLFSCPEIARLFVIQHGNDSGYARNLTDLFQGYRIILRPVPAHCHFHKGSPFSFFIYLYCGLKAI